MQSRHALVASLALSLVSVAGLAAGCGGGGKSPSVASLGSSQTGTTTTQSASSPAGSAQSGSSGGGANMTLKTQNGEKFSACMRSHGVPNFPDPNSQGAIQIGSSSGIDPNSPKFQAAQTACQKLLPNGGRPSPQQVAKMQKAALAYSACMRKHGLPDFPDPVFSGGGARLSLRGGPGSDLNPNSATFQAAQKACQGLLPGKGNGK